MIKAFFLAVILFHSYSAWSQSVDSIKYIHIHTDNGIVHAAVAVPEGKGPFPAIIILHGTHGFASEYVKLARDLAKNGFVGIAVCWFAGRKGEGVRYITPIEFTDAPPLVDVAGPDRFKLARVTIDSVIQKANTLSAVLKNNIAIFGHSRGAGASLDYVLTNPKKIKALILNSAGYPSEVIDRVHEINIPVLILHGTADGPADGGSTFTNIEKAREFERSATALKKNIQVKYFEASGHNSLFTDPNQFTVTVQTVSDFLKKIFAIK